MSEQQQRSIIGLDVEVFAVDPRRTAQRISSDLRHGQHLRGRTGKIMRAAREMIMVRLDPDDWHGPSREWLFRTELRLLP